MSTTMAAATAGVPRDLDLAAASLKGATAVASAKLSASAPRAQGNDQRLG
jgi:hypothetical protein